MIDLAISYCDEREVTPDYRQALLRVARSMGAAGITPSMLTESLVNRWLATLKQSPVTRSNYRRMCLTLCRHAIDRRECGQFIGRVVRVKSKISPPVAWSMAELSTLISAAKQMQGTLRNGCPESLYFEAWIRAGFETGLRFSDLLTMKCSCLRGDRLYVVANKTGVPIPKVLSARCVQILTELSVYSGGVEFFRPILSERWLRIRFARLCKSAGLNGTPKWLRRSGATHCEIRQPGSAKRFLGHLSDGLALKHYVDQTLLPDQCPAPPPIP
jgi:integrase